MDGGWIKDWLSYRLYSDEDQPKLQGLLNALYNWAEDNDTLFSESKSNALQVMNLFLDTPYHGSGEKFIEWCLLSHFEDNSIIVVHILLDYVFSDCTYPICPELSFLSHLTTNLFLSYNPSVPDVPRPDIFAC